MDRHAWREEVARLLEQTAQSLRTRNDRNALIAFGTALAYIEKARQRGESIAGELLGQSTEPADSPTDRFTFTPGELELLRSPSKNK